MICIHHILGYFRDLVPIMTDLENQLGAIFTHFSKETINFQDIQNGNKSKKFIFQQGV